MFYPRGVPVEMEQFEKYPPEVKTAWEIFDAWWKENWDGEGPVSWLQMPIFVAEAMDLIFKTPIPGYEEDGLTGKDSCYMVNVAELLTD